METRPRITKKYQMLKFENALAQAACWGPSNLLYIFAAPQAYPGHTLGL